MNNNNALNRKMWEQVNISNKIHIMNKIISLFEDVNTVKKPIYIDGHYSHCVSHYECPCAFDIETSSFYSGNNKRATMYIWQLGLNHYTFVGRTWAEFIWLLNLIRECIGLNNRHYLIIYTHNLSFEFQWIRKLFTWEKVFALDTRKPVQCMTNDGFEFRCSYILSGYSLEKVGEHLTKYKITKKVGQLDYDLIRHSETPISSEEMEYCVDDVRVVMAFIQEEIERNNGILNIPLTKTGYVRRACRNACFYDENEKNKKKSKKRSKYLSLMRQLTITPAEYRQLRRAFQGGFTHANPLYADNTLENIGSDDETSAYPTVMVAEQFPMSKAEEIEINTREEFEHNIDLYCCLFDVEFVNLQPKIYFENYISISRCWETSNTRTANGRIVSADMIKTTITETDYRIINKCYTWDKMRVFNFKRYRKGYLPTDFVKCILLFYETKTKLKNVDGAEVEYLHAKENINSCYGMVCMNVCRDDIIYTNQWEESKHPDIIESIEKYNTDKNRFLFFPWAVWVTAYSRRNLWAGILEYGTDYVYSDTDSVKGKNREKHLHFFEEYNDIITKQLKRAMDYHGLPYELIHPKTIYGEEKPLGVWDFEGTYTRYRSLGAKRYMTEKDGKISLTVSGVNKKAAVPYLMYKYGTSIFDEFTDGLTIPGIYSGKLTHTYLDEPFSGIVTDYLGNSYEYRELSAVHLAPSDYHLSMAEPFIEYLKGLQNK